MDRQLRAVILGDFDNYLSYFTYGALDGGIRSGMWVRPVPLFGHSLDVIENQINWFKPHILLCHCIFNTKPHNRDDVFAMLSRVKKNGTVIFYHLGDARTNPRYPGDISSFISASLINQNNTKHFEEIWKVPCFKWPYPCLYQYRIFPPVEDFKCKIAFTGELNNTPGNVHYDRTVFINKLSKYLPVRMFPDPKVGNTRFQTAEVASSSDMIFGRQMTNIPGYLDVRPYQYIGAGALYIHNRCDQIFEVFEDKKHFLAYDSPEEIRDLHDYYVVKNPDGGTKIRNTGVDFCQRNHGTKNRMDFVKDLYSKLC